MCLKKLKLIFELVFELEFEMITLKGTNIYLRALEPEDLEFIYKIENNESVWDVSNTQTPYSRFLIRQYLENAHQDIYEAKQLRLAICLNAYSINKAKVSVPIPEFLLDVFLIKIPTPARLFLGSNSNKSIKPMA